MGARRLATAGRSVKSAALSDQSLFEPLAFPCGASAPNRIWLAPLTNGQSHDDGTLGDDELRWLVRRAAGGFGVITTCAAYVDLGGKGWPGELGVDDDRDLPGLRRLAGELDAHGSLGIAQIFHGGVRAPRAVTGTQPMSASTWTEDAPDFEPPRAATEDDLARVIGCFAAAAARCAQAGLGGVEIHGAHGYLPSQFLSRTMNQRDDRWGGTLANRARLVREIVRAVRAAVPARFVVGVRLSPEDFGQARGLDLDETVEVARWLCDDGVDYVHLSLWRVERNTSKRPEEHALALFRAALPAAVPLVAAGAIWTPAEAAATLARGAAAVALGRSAIVNPEWPRHAREAGWEPRRPPLTAAELAALDVSPRFVAYLRRFKNLVAD
jgi:2,4-dienoyl-CoA reductase-like NADH-dependent reductase (Old Yellow Enzyme family)